MGLFPNSAIFVDTELEEKPVGAEIDEGNILPERG
jgi:hypothetical protein